MSELAAVKAASTDPMDTDPMSKALKGIQYAFPAAILVYFAIASAVSVIYLQTRQSPIKHPRQTFICSLMIFIAISFLGQVANLFVPSIIEQKWLGQADTTVTQLACFLMFGLVGTQTIGVSPPVWYPYIGCYMLLLVFDPVIVVLSILERRLDDLGLLYSRIDLGIVVTRYTASVLLLSLYFLGRGHISHLNGSASERAPLLPNKKPTSSEESGETEESQASSSYGTTEGTQDDEESQNSAKNDTAKKDTTKKDEPYWQRLDREHEEAADGLLKESGNWINYIKKFRVFVPLIWPVNSRALQLRAFLTGICLLAQNALNVLVPRQFGVLTDTLNKANDASPWVQVIIFLCLKLASSQVGISLLKRWLWLPVKNYSTQSLHTAAFSHIMSLSSDFHDDKSSHEIFYDVHTGTQCVGDVLNTVLMDIGPNLIDLVAAFIYLSVTFGPYCGLITTATALAFFFTTWKFLKLSQERIQAKWNCERVRWKISQNGVRNWSTVTNFNRVPYENDRHSSAVEDSVLASLRASITKMVINIFEYLIPFAGLTTAVMLAVYQVQTDPKVTAGDFVMLLTYWSQLTVPLQFFSGLSEKFSEDMIHSHRLLVILTTKATVVDADSSRELQCIAGKVTFNRVSFTYDNKKDILRDLTFVAMPGTTTAFVGATGAGKSTILKLMNRLYDVTAGSIKIDGQNIQDIKLSSLRSAFGVVPQNPVLFDDTVMKNVLYAKLDASPEDVYEACKAAAIHDQIMGFPDGYETQVGEQGQKLSGGQIQRIAVARAILKTPSIVILDEASSAVDTETEQKMQAALAELCKNRTTFVVAHRLSTVMNADNIIVIDDGRILEQGNHEELLKANGKYASLWSKQGFWMAKPPKPKEEEVLINDLGDDEVQVASHPRKGKERALSSEQDIETEHSDMISADVKNSETAVKTSGHKKEKSALNPIASTFTPRDRACAVTPATTPAPQVALGLTTTAKDNLAGLKAAFEEPTKTETATAKRGSDASESSSQSASAALQSAHAKDKSASKKVT